MVTIQSGAVKFKSATAAFAAAKRSNPKLKWITFYMRLRAGMSYQAAAKAPVRKYRKTVRFAYC